jgi:medium-chain acyl-[acyl-carrier-protein] hydrolase
MHLTNSLCLLGRQLKQNSALRLFCFPYAGGSIAIYRGWQQMMPEGVEVCPVHLPGRGTRIKETLVCNLEHLLTELARELSPYLDRPFSFFGHSMGALISFELARRLRIQSGVEPVHLLVSAWRSPDLIDHKRDYDLPRAEFIEVLRKLNGTPEEILADAEALELLLPILRADFEVVQAYRYREEQPLTCAIKAFAGMRDSGTAPEQMSGWRKHTTGPFSLSILPGDHFFIHQSRMRLITEVANELAPAVDLLAVDK